MRPMNDGRLAQAMLVVLGQFTCLAQVHEPLANQCEVISCIIIL